MRRRNTWAALAALFAGPLLELAHWILCRDLRHYVEMREHVTPAYVDPWWIWEASQMDRSGR